MTTIVSVKNVTCPSLTTSKEIRVVDTFPGRTEVYSDGVIPSKIYE